jgi:hypothetical protein
VLGVKCLGFKYEYQLRVDDDIQCHEQIDVMLGFKLRCCERLTSESRSRLIQLFGRAFAASYNEDPVLSVFCCLFIFFLPDNGL